MLLFGVYCYFMMRGLVKLCIVSWDAEIFSVISSSLSLHASGSKVKVSQWQAQKLGRGISPTNSQPSTKMRWVSRTTLRPFYSREIHGTPCTRSWVGLEAGLDEAKTLAIQRDSLSRPSIPYRLAVPKTLLRPPVLMLVCEIYIVSRCVCT
jgi:hypothetical protein